MDAWALLERPDVPEDVRRALQSGLAEAEAEREGLRSEIVQLRAALAELRAERDDASRVIDASPALVCRIATDGTTLSVNSACERATGYAASELVGRNWWATLYPGDDYRQAEQVLAAMEAGPVADYEMVLTAKSGERRTISWASLNRPDGEGRPLEIVGFGIDITEQRRHEAAARRAADELTQSEQRYRLIEQRTRDDAWSVDLEGRYTRVSPAMVRLLGYTNEELAGRSFAETMAPESFARAQSAMAEGVAAARAGEAASFCHVGEYEVIARDGRRVWVEIDAGVLVDDAGEAVGFAGVSRDITARRAAAVRLAESEANLRAVVETTDDMVFSVGPDGVLLASNRAFDRAMEEVFGRTVPVGESVLAFNREYASWWEPRIVRALAGERVREEFPRALDPRGLEHEASVSPILDGGRVVGACCVLRDVTAERGAQRALAAERNLLRTIVDLLPDQVFVKDPEGRFILANRQVVARLGLASESELIGRTDADFVGPTRGRQLFDEERAVMATGQGFTAREYHHPGRDGREEYYLSTKLPLRDAGGHVIGLVGVNHWTTEERLMRLEAEESRARLAAMLNVAPAGFILMRDRVILEATDYVAQITGRLVDDLVGRSPRELYATEEEFSRVSEVLYGADDARDLSTVDTQFVRPDGSVVDVLLYACPLDPMDPDSPTLGIALDITERKRVERALQAEQARLAAVLRAAPGGLTVVGDGVLELVSGHMAEMVGRSSDELTGRSTRILFPTDEEFRRVEVELHGQLAKDGYGSVETQHVRRDGTAIDVLLTACPLDERDPTGAMVVAALDITERKRAEQALQAERARLAAILRAAPAGIALLDGRTVVEMNDCLAEMTGRAPEELRGKTTRCLYVDDDEYRRVGEVLYGGPGERELRAVETQFVCADGATIDVLMRACPLDPLQREGLVIVTALDITERKRAEEELRLSSQRMKLHVDRTPLGVIEWDMDFRVTEWNPAAEAIFGYPRAEALGQRGHFIVPESAQRRVDEIWRGLATGSGQERITNINVRKDGTLLTCEWYNTPLVNEAGDIVGAASLVLDITERTRADEERRRLEANAQRLQRLEGIGVLAGGIAHDFNNLLSAILGFGELAVMDAPEGSRERQRLEQIVAAGERARDLVRQILTFSRMHESHPVAIPLAPLITESLKFLRASLPSTIEFRTAIDAGCGKVLVDPTQFHQVVMNLCTNAGQAMAQGGGVLEVQLTEVEVDPALAERVSVAKLGRYARLTVSDTGTGMDATTLDRVFEPFFTTKPTGEGTGLGLSTVHGVVRSHGGGITVYSEPGVGTTFHVYLPIAPTSADPTVEDDGVLPAGSERIMVVDDEPAVAAVATEALRALGYQVEEFTDSRQALRTFREEPSRYDLILTDQTMPHFTGTQLLASMQFMRPELPVIIATGFHPRVQLSSLAAGPPPAILIKPYTIAELARQVRGALDEASARQSGVVDG